MSTSNRPRLIDVARLVDVAPSTVSRALAGSSSVSSATRERVLTAARELGYTVNLAASGLKRGQTLSIGLITVDNYWYAGEVTAGADRVASANGYDFVVMSSVNRLDEATTLARARRLGSRVDGVLIVDVSNEDGHLQRLIDAVRVPVVTLGSAAPGVRAVVVDNTEIGAQAAQHLSGFGHRRVVVLAPISASPAAENNARVRSEGFISANPWESVQTSWLPIDDRGARQAAILEVTRDVTAAFCVTDELAIETVSILRQANRRVPSTLSVVGVDDHPLAQPIGLTTIAQQPTELGAVGAQQLLDSMHRLPDEPLVTVMPTRLVERQTSGAALD